MLGPEDPCPSCGGAIVAQQGPGRFTSYRGEAGYSMPAEIDIPTCSTCGAEWVDSATLTRLDAALELQRAARASQAL